LEALMQSRARDTRITLAAVAQDAGVALSTASIILSRNAAYLRNFSEATIVRVRASAERLGYRPSLIASGLPSKGSSLFFLVALHDLHRGTDGDRFLWGFDADLLGGITEASQAVQVYPIVTLTRAHTAEADGETLDRVIRGGVFGAIIRSPSPLLENQIQVYLRESRPVVVAFPSVLARWPTNVVEVDNVAMGRRAGKLLAEQSRSKWMIVLDEHEDAHSLRLRGFQAAAAREKRVIIEIVKCPSRLNARDTSSLLSIALTRFQPDGVFALTSRTAEATLDACKTAGRVPGQDTLLIGCDCSVWNRPLMPKITSLEASWREVGHQALGMLLKMRDEGKARHPRVLLDPILIPGDTCPSDAGDNSAHQEKAKVSGT
jgi:DNA-binding LacI/PurR family transcriptional regulator